VVTEKKLQKILKLNTRHKNTAWKTPQIKNIETNHELTLIGQQTQSTKREIGHLKFLTPVTPTEDEILNPHGFKI
jgi:hypothetical protein